MPLTRHFIIFGCPPFVGPVVVMLDAEIGRTIEKRKKHDDFLLVLSRFAPTLSDNVKIIMEDHEMQ